jgi:hypothetical protein
MSNPLPRKHEHHFPGFRPAMYGYLVSGLIFTTMIYGLLLQMYDDNIAACKSRNLTRIELNERAVAIDRIFTILIDADVLARTDNPTANRAEVAGLARLRNDVEQVPLVNCDEEFSKPWPL